MQIATTGSPTPEEVAAAMAAISVLLAEEAVAHPPAPPPTNRWRDSMRLIAQGLPPARVPAAPHWSTIERIRRAGRGSTGIVGM